MLRMTSGAVLIAVLALLLLAPSAPLRAADSPPDDLGGASHAMLSALAISSYEDPANTVPPGDDFSRVQELRAAFHGEHPGEDSFTHQPALDFVARVVALYFARRGQLPAASYMDWLAWKVGVVGRFESASVLKLGEGLRGVMRHNVLDNLYPGEKVSSAPCIYGLSILRTGRRDYLQVALSFRQPLRIASLPKYYQAGQDFHLQARLRHPYDQLEFFMDVEQGGLYSTPLQVDPSGNLEVNLRLPLEAGRYFVEIRGVPEDLRGQIGASQTLLLLPVYVEEREPPLPPAWMLPSTEADSQPADWAALILDSYNRERGRLGLEPLVADPVVAELAADWAGRLASGQVSGFQPELSSRLASEGVPHTDIYRMQAHVTSPRELAARALQEPSFRYQVLDFQVSRLGVGFSPVETGKPDHVSVTYLVATPPPFQQELEVRRLYQAAVSLRRAAGMSGFRADPVASSIVADFADRVCRGELAPDDMDTLKKTLRHGLDEPSLSLVAQQWTGSYLPPDDLSGFDVILTRADRPRLAVHACRGDIPGQPSAEYVIFVVLAGR